MTCSKRAYGQKAAIKEAKRLRAKSGEPFRCYACPDCGRWHLTGAVETREGISADEIRRSRRGQRTDGMSLDQIRELAERMRGST